MSLLPDFLAQVLGLMLGLRFENVIYKICLGVNTCFKVSRFLYDNAYFEDLGFRLNNALGCLGFSCGNCS